MPILSRVVVGKALTGDDDDYLEERTQNVVLVDEEYDIIVDEDFHIILEPIDVSP